MQKRSVAFVDTLAKLHPQQTVLVVVHAGVIRGLISHYMNLVYAANLKQKISHRYIGDFRFGDGAFAAYTELGKLSGFARDGLVETAGDPAALPGIGAGGKLGRPGLTV
jgi:broad specificity phosphatase PhoE